MSGRMVARYDYLNVKGEPRLQKIRFEPKKFLMLSWHAERGWVKGVIDERFRFWLMALYRLPEVVAALRVDVAVAWAEGEKDVEALEKLGLIATTTPNPSDLWDDQARWFTKCGTASEVLLVCDQDAHGGWWGWERYTRLLKVGIDPNRITVLTPKKRWHKDAADVVEAGLGLDGFRVVDLDRLRTCADRYSASRVAPYTSEGRVS